MAFVDEIVKRIKLLPELFRQEVQTAKAGATARRVEKRLKEATQEPPSRKPQDLLASLRPPPEAQTPNILEQFKGAVEEPKPLLEKITPEQKESAGRVRNILIEVARTFPREGAGLAIEAMERPRGTLDFLTGRGPAVGIGPIGPRASLGEAVFGPGKDIGTGLSIQPGAGTVLPPKVELALFGEDPVPGIEEQGREIMQGFGFSENTASQYGLAAGLVVVGLDILPPGSDDFIKLLVKTNKASEVKTILKTSGFVDDIKITDDVAHSIARSKDPRAIKKIVDDVTTPSMKQAVEGVKAEDVIKRKPGRVPPGKAPEPKVPKGQKERGFTKRIRKDPTTPTEMKQGLGKVTYTPITNKETLAAARARVKASLSEAENFLNAGVAKGGEMSAEHTATGVELIKHYQEIGNYQKAVDIAETTATSLTKAGQSVQAAKLYETLSPEGVLIVAKRLVKRSNTKKLGFQKEIQLTDEVAENLTDLAKAREAATDPLIREELGYEIGQQLNALKRSTFLQKLSTTQVIAQLLNFKTIIRNILGNEIFYRTERLSKYVAAPIDWAKSKLTGTDRVITFRTGAQGKFWESFLKGWKIGWKGLPTPGLPTKFDIPIKTFKAADRKIKIMGREFNLTLNPLYWGEKVVGGALRGFDFAAYNRAKIKTLGELGFLDGINKGMKGNKLREHAIAFAQRADDNIHQIAHDYGKYVTFQDDNVISIAFQEIKGGLNAGKDFGVGDLAIKYPRTPGALLARGIEYSPAGFVRSAWIAAEPIITGKPANSREALMALSRAVTGTLGTTGLGYHLADIGVLTGVPSEDRDVRAFERMIGTGQYKVNVSALSRWVFSGFDGEEAKRQEGDTMVSYDWAQPVAIAFSVGANMRLAQDEHAEVVSRTQTIIESLEGGVNTLVEQPLVAGIVRLFGYGDPTKGFTQTILVGLPSSLTPTLFNQFRQWLDNTRRDAYSPSVLQQGLNYAKRKVPGLAQKLPPMVDQWGREAEEFQNASNNLFNVFFNPSFVTTYLTDPEAQVVIDIFEQTGETKQFPKIAPKSLTINGQKVEMSAREIGRFQTIIGTKTQEAFSAMAESEAFMALHDDEKAQLMANVLTNISKEAQDEMFGTNKASAVTYEDRLNFLEIQSLAKGGNLGAAKAIVDSMSDEAYESYRSVRSSWRAKNTKILRELLDSSPPDAVIFLRDQHSEEQERLLDVMTDDEYEVYNKAKPAAVEKTDFGEPDEPKFEDGEEKDEQTLIDDVLLYARAVFVDPVTAFNRIFTGQKIRRIDHDTIIVERMPLEVSQRIKRELGATTGLGQEGEFLDHIVPLELGGSEEAKWDSDNYQLVTHEEWSRYTPLENHLGRLLRAEKITGAKAQELIKKFKKGEITADEIYAIK